MHARLVAAVLTLTATLSAQMAWSSVGLAGHDRPGLVTDWARGNLLLVGGTRGSWTFGSNGVMNTTHVWDGTQWRARRPSRTPLSGTELAMTYDVARSRAVLCAGSLRLETWEWDGSDWSERLSATVPPPREGHGMAYDWVRRRTVLFGGLDPSGAPLADTWEWDGTNWRQLQPARAPTARAFHSMAFELQSGRVLLFGGTDFPFSTSVLGDTWTWDGTSWTQVQLTTQPSARSAATIALDLARSRVVLHGGNGGNGQPMPADTWEWDGTTWTQVATSGPPPRDGGAMAYEPGARRTVFFGGYRGPVGNDMWAWDGTQWTRLVAALEPQGRADHGLAFDRARGRAVLFGGVMLGSVRLSDTWEWDGDGWIPMTPATSPSARSRHALAYDPVRGRTVLFGGDDGAPRNDTWEWDGSTWTQRFPTISPPPQADHAMVWDGARQRVFLCGADNWEWDGSNWTARPSSVRPPSTQYHALAYDPRRGRVLFFGGTAWRFELFEWDGTNWTALSPTYNPGARRGAAMVFDETLGRVVLFGGSSQGVGPRNDVWTWDGSSWVERTSRPWPWATLGHRMVYDSVRECLFVFGGSGSIGVVEFTYELSAVTPGRYQPFGSGCPGTVGTPVLAAAPWQRPWQGETFTAQVGPLPASAFGVMLLGASNSSWLGIPLPLPLAASGMPGCTLLASGQVLLPLQIAAGAGTVSLNVPATPALLGSVFYQQALIVDPPANAAGLILSNAAQARIGQR